MKAIRFAVAAALAGMVMVATVRDAPSPAAPPRPEGILPFAMGEMPDRPGRVWLLYLVRFTDGRLGVIVRYQADNAEQDAFFGSMLPVACEAPQELFVPLVPSEAVPDAQEDPRRAG